MIEINEMEKLLSELRDIQREHLAEYRKVTNESLELQRRAVLRQEQAVKFSSRIVAFLIMLIIFLTILLLLLRIGNYITFV